MTHPQHTAPAATQPQVLLQVQDLNAWYGAAHILFDLNLTVGKGEVVALMGRNGAGKSTTIESIMGLVKHQGLIRFMGQDIVAWKPHQIARAGIGFVPEERRIFADLSVMENLDTGRQPPRVWPDGQAVAHWSTEAIFSLFPNLADMRTRRGGQMSGGEQQMLAVARTLMGNPFLLLLDEPSEGVAPIVVEQMIKMVLALKAQGVSILLSEQNMDFARQVCDRVYILEKGQIKYENTMDALTHDMTAKAEYPAV
ncbi:ABC transporter ATP-binding protein [Advenella mimigardefordensis]|uniref:Putative high-affinity branched-chain amino acid transport ATP-binding protein n=1 Tax=Advenella mimigardefordensis (strain DSM 17166 / LMG 22922 / DPN7) TaxID=1247726 RepID=W0PGK4_ADVMD|nr:ABC transporter ATP-binding protein [Advenella mimigardefordensis]AHG64340.1 putative high-affinity branched-chain amino acid transport ATP-binding protein [Advenella mimigardefordensis DPN7]